MRTEQTRIEQFAKVRELAKRFLDLADELNEKVSAYLDGDDSEESVNAYYDVISANRAFLREYTRYYDEPMMQPHLDYEIAESVL